MLDRVGTCHSDIFQTGCDNDDGVRRHELLSDLVEDDVGKESMKSDHTLLTKLAVGRWKHQC